MSTVSLPSIVAQVAAPSCVVASNAKLIGGSSTPTPTSTLRAALTKGRQFNNVLTGSVSIVRLYSESKHVVCYDIPHFMSGHTGYYSNIAGETDIPNAVPVKVAARIGAGTPSPVTFGGNVQGVIPAASTDYLSDPITPAMLGLSGSSIPTGTVVILRHQWDVVVGAKVPFSNWSNAPGQGDYATYTDGTESSALLLTTGLLEQRYLRAFPDTPCRTASRWPSVCADPRHVDRLRTGIGRSFLRQRCQRPY